MTGPILVPTDFSDHSAAAFAWAKKMAVALDAPLRCIYVARDPATYAGTEYIIYNFPPLEEIREQAEEKMKTFVSEHKLDADMETQVLIGTPFVEIIRDARVQKASMIVMSTHGHSGLTHVLLGSTTAGVVRKASCPVLSIPAGVEFEMP